MKYFVFFLLIISSSYLKGQNHFHVVEFKIINEQTKMFVPKVEVLVPDIDKQFLSDKSGNLKIMLSPNAYYFYFSHKEYHSKALPVQLFTDTIITVQLIPNLRSYYIDDVTVSTNQSGKSARDIPGIERIDPIMLSQIPTLGGEKDIIKVIQKLPGIKAGSEGSSEIIVRGGSSDQNLFLFDNAVIYNPDHLLGFLSTYNPMMVGRTVLYKGAFPTEYGNRLPSVIDVKSKASNYHKMNAELSIGTLSAKGFVNAPIIKGKSSVFISGRRSYFDALIYPFQDKVDYSSLNFHDLFVKYSHTLTNGILSFGYYSDRDKQYSRYKPKDNTYHRDYSDIIKKNTHYHINWNIKQSWGTNDLSIQYINYLLSMDEIRTRPDSLNSFSNSFRSSINDITVKNKLLLKLGEHLNLTSGIEATVHKAWPAKFSWSDYYIDTLVNRIDKSILYSINPHVQAHYTIHDKHVFLLGVRSSFINFNNNWHHVLEPRLAYNFHLSDALTLKASYSKMSQPMHLLTNPGLGMPIDIWIPAENNLPVENSDIFSLGLYSKLKVDKQKINFNAEIYYKQLKNILCYRNGYSSHNLTSLSGIQIKSISDMLTLGNGQAYGFEFSLDKSQGDVKVWLSYTLSWIKHSFDEIDNGKFFHPRYDSRNNFSITGNYDLTHKWSVGINWVYYTGQAVTIPVSSYFLYQPDYVTGRISTIPNEYVLYEQSERNTYRMKDYHTLNIDFKRTVLFKKRTAILEFGAYNIYNRKNAYYYYFDIEHKNNNNFLQSNVKSVSVFPIIPYVSFSIKF